MCLYKIYQDKLGQMANFLYLCNHSFCMLFQDKLKVKELRISRKLLQRQVAAGIDVDTDVHCKIENGDRQARETQVHQIAFFYGIPYEDLRRYWLPWKIDSFAGEDKDVSEILDMVAEEIKEYITPPTKTYKH